MNPVARLAGRVVISCQAPPGHPLEPTPMITLLARCAELGGAGGVRVDRPERVAAVKAAVTVPVIGLHKVPRPGARSRITPTVELALGLARAGADLVAVEAVAGSESFALIRRLAADLPVPVLADVATVAEAERAYDAGAALVATTLSGYTVDSPQLTGPDLELVSALADRGIPAVAEGRFRTAGEVAEAFASGAHAVVVGTAVTDPVAITSWLVAVEPSRVGPASGR
jgi:N-acylglucosamine-6-phosphate 2-epimerase